MRLLVVTHEFPPPIAGGYEAMAWDVCTSLAARGHTVHVLTTDRPRTMRHQVSTGPTVTGALRAYYKNGEGLYPPLREAVAIERRNLSALTDALESHRPDVVSFWHMGALSLNLIAAAADFGYRLTFVIGDDWLVYGAWADGWHRRFLSDLHPHRSRAIARITGIPTDLPDLPKLGAFYFVSAYTRSRANAHFGVELPGGVIPPGLPTQFFENRAPQFTWNDELLWVGRVRISKGVFTALKALAQLPRTTRLRILGSDDAEFGPALQEEIARLGLSERVSWSYAPREQLPEEYRRAAVTLFTSEIEHEAFGLTALEAMASGSVVVSTGVGGNAEFCRHDVNCLTYPPGDFGALAMAITRLRDDPPLRRRLGLAGVATAERYTLDRQVDALEDAHASAMSRQPVSRRHSHPTLE